MGIYDVAPPRQNRVLANRAVLGVLQSEEDDHDTDAVTRVQTSRQNILTQTRVIKCEHWRLHEKQKDVLTVILGPPVKVAPTDETVKHVADEHPGYIIERCRGRQAARVHKDDREIEILEGVESELFV